MRVCNQAFATGFANKLFEGFEGQVLVRCYDSGNAEDEPGVSF